MAAFSRVEAPVDVARSLDVMRTVYLLLVSLGLYAIFRVSVILTRPIRSPLRVLPGPPSKSFLFGNVGEIMGSRQPFKHEGWLKEHGHVFRTRGIFRRTALVTTDRRAMTHILNHTVSYPKPPTLSRILRSILGNGVLVAEGHDHTIQRRVLNPSFAPAQIRELTEVFVEKANKLRDLWMDLAQQSNGPIRIDALGWLSKATLEVIGIAGFGYDFDSLNHEGRENELNTAFSKVFLSTEQPSILDFITIPGFGRLPTKKARDAAEGLKTMHRIARGLIAQKKRAVIAAAGGEKANVVVEKGDIQGRDLLSVLIKANMASDLPPNQRLSDEDVLAQVPTFITAGHETSSTATMWALFALSQNKAAQQTLREELRAFSHEEPTMDELNSLPYLDAVVRETLRTYNPVTTTSRIAAKDDIIPLDKPFTDVNGKIHTSIKISKGDQVIIPILLISRLEEIFGPDAKEFKPERWFDIPEAATHIPTMWGNTLAFLAGPRGCIGYRFALVEVKALLFALVRNFEFDLAVPADDVTSKTAVVQRPYLLSEPEKGNQLPLMVKPYTGA